MRLLQVGILATIFAASSFAGILTITHTGTGSGSIDGNPFSNASFVITATADTANVDFDFGVYSLDHSSTTIEIDGVGTLTFIPALRTFATTGVVGTSRAGLFGADLYSGPFDAALVGWDLQSSIGPVSGTTELLQWNLDPVVTSGGVLLFDDEFVNGTFTATLAPTAVPEPGTWVLLGSGAVVLLFARRRRFTKL